MSTDTGEFNWLINECDIAETLIESGLSAQRHHRVNVQALSDVVLDKCIEAIQMHLDKYKHERRRRQSASGVNKLKW